MTMRGSTLVADAPERSRFEITVDGAVAGFALYKLAPGRITFVHTEIDDAYAGHGLGASHDAGALIRVIAGEVDGIKGPGSTHTPMTMVHATVSPGAEMTLPWRTEFNALVYVMNGDGYVGRERRAIHTGQLAVLGHGETITVGADTAQESRHPALDVIVLGGQPIREPIAWAGPFVMNTKAEVLQAFEDYQKGKLGTIPSVPHADVHGELKPD